MPASNDTPDALAFVVRAVSRRKLLMAAFLTLAILGGYSGTKLARPAYRSEAKLFLRLGRENATLEPTATLGQNPVVAAPPSRDSELNSAQSLLTSQPLLEKVVDKLGAGLLRGQLPQPGEQ